MSGQHIRQLVASLGDLHKVLCEAHPADKSEIYQRLGLRLDYQPGNRKVRVEAHLNPHPIGKRYVSGGRAPHWAHALDLRKRLTLV